jgi:hypothetical protein
MDRPSCLGSRHTVTLLLAAVYQAAGLAGVHQESTAGYLPAHCSSALHGS